jgi:hypothetical protein
MMAETEPNGCERLTLVSQVREDPHPFQTGPDTGERTEYR